MLAGGTGGTVVNARLRWRRGPEPVDADRRRGDEHRLHDLCRRHDHYPGNEHSSDEYPSDDRRRSFQIQAVGIAQIIDQVGAPTREFTVGANVTSATLADDGVANNGLSQFTTSLGTSITFAAPTSSRVDAGAGGQLNIVGNDARGGGSFRGSAGEIIVSGTLTTHAATIDLAAQSSLTVTAGGLIQNSGGFVRLDAGESGTLQVLGRIDVSSTASAGQGGTVQLLGQTVKLLDGAAIDASGPAGGGTVLVGGGLHGQDPLVRRATNTLVAATARSTLARPQAATAARSSSGPTARRSSPDRATCMPVARVRAAAALSKRPASSICMSMRPPTLPAPAARPACGCSTRMT